MADPKDIASMLAAKLGPDGKPKAEPLPGASGDDAGGDPSDDSAPDEGEQAAAEDMLTAMKSADPSQLASALKAFIQMCMSKY